MQTTLLGLAIAFIVALVAALIGPYFIDWSRFRPQFEAEASRILGTPVRVGGGLDARLLPTPSLRLQSVVIGGANDPGRIRAADLAVEFSLGALMRGEWRATELTVNGVALDLGLDAAGRIDWPVAAGNPNLGALSIDRLNLTGRVALHDAASRATLELNDIAFSGDVRALAGSIRGNGNFMVGDTRYPFRVASSRDDAGGGARVHLTLEPGLHGLTADLEGALRFEARAPRFEGTVTLARSAPDGTAPDSVTPWRLAAKLKADPARASLAQLDLSYGIDEAALKLTGLVDFRFGAKPLAQALLSAKQLDADKMLSKQSGSTGPVRMLPGLRALLSALPPTRLPTRVDINAERIMLGGRPVQDLDLTLRADAGTWSVDRLEVRAPGATEVGIHGAMAASAAGDDASPDADSFKGRLKVDSADPGAFAGWLLGRADMAARTQRPLHVAGDVHLASDRIAIDDLKADIDGDTITGRVAWSARKAGRASEFDADLTADRLDLDAAAAFVSAIGIPQTEWPDHGALALNVASAVLSGQKLRPLTGRLGYDATTVTLDGLRVGQPSGIALDGSGVFHRDTATGNLTLQASAPSLAGIAGLIEPWSLSVAARLQGEAARASGAARLTLDVALAADAGDATRASARAALRLDAPRIKGGVTLRAAPAREALRKADWETLARTGLDLEADAAAPQGAALLGWLGLDGAIAATDGPARLTATAQGKWDAPWQVKAGLSAGALNAEAHGSVTPATPALDLTLKLRGANVAPLFDLAASNPLGQGASLSSRVTLSGDKLRFGDIDASVEGTRLRGRVDLTLGDDRRFDGELGMDALNLPQAFALLIGAAGRDNGAPLGKNLLDGMRGRIAFQALRGDLPAGLQLQPVSGVLRSDGRAIAIDTVKGTIGGGEARADFDARRTADGLALSGEVQLDGVDGKALRYRGLAMPAGRASLRMTFASQGRSVAALTGALTGSGTLTIDKAEIAGLNPKAFEVAIAAGDSGKPPDDERLRRIVTPELLRGGLAVKQAQIPFILRDGRISVGATTLEADGARAVVSGGYDIVADQADLRANLTSRVAGSETSPPQLDIFAAGTPDMLKPMVDVAGLSSWLALRAIERETRRLDAIGRGEATAPPAVAAVPPASTPAATPAPTPDRGEAKPEAAVPDLPTSDVPLPGSDPRRAPARPSTSTARPVAPTPAADKPAASAVAPLPPPIEVRPAPSPKAARPHAPLVLTPPIAREQRPGF